MAVALVVLQIPSYVAPLTEVLPAKAAATILPPTAPALAVVPFFDTHTVVATPGQTVPFSWSAGNPSSTDSWDQDAGTDVNLSICVQAPTESRSVFSIECDQPSPNPTWNSNEDWASATRYATQLDPTVNPDGTATYNWAVTVPPGTLAGEYTFLAAFVQRGSGARSAVFKQMVRVPSGIVYRVNNNSDGTTCNAENCQLRGALLASEVSAGPDTIIFDLPTGATTIAPEGENLPTLFQSVVIDATTQPGFVGLPIVELTGTSQGSTASGLSVRAATIRGLVINHFARWGIDNDGGGFGLIAGNFIGTNITGTSAEGTGNGTRDDPTTGGIRVRTGGYFIGTMALGDSNVVSGNLGQGIQVTNDAPGTFVLGNIVGAGVGRLALPNAQFGLLVQGTGATVQDNLIANNAAGGIRTEAGNGTYRDNVVRGNFFGIRVASSNNTFDRNEISSNRGAGVVVGGSNLTVSNNSFTDNRVLDNTVRGFELFGQVGGPGVTERNSIRRGSITGHTFEGILLDFGANNGIAPPTLRTADSSGVMSVSGVARLNATVDVYVDPTDEGNEFVGSVRASDGDGTWSFVIPPPFAARVRTGEVRARATQTDTNFNTSQFSVAGATDVISGTASCGPDSSPLANVTVQLLQGEFLLATTRSDSEGAYTFTGVGAGTFTLKFLFGEGEPCTDQVTLHGDGEVTFGDQARCTASNTWLTARPLVAGAQPLVEAICDGGRRWYKIQLAAGGNVVPPLSRIVARLTGVQPGDLRLPGDFTLMLVKDPTLALKPVATAADAHKQFGGDTFGGDTFGGDTFGGDTFGGDTFGGDTFGGDTFGGDTFGGDTFGGDTFGGDTFGGDTFGGDTFGGDTFGGDTFGGDTFGGDTFGGDTFGGDTFGGKFLLSGGDPKAYAAAIARSVVRVAAHRGTSPEGLWQNTWANSNTWYLRVSSHRGASGPFKISSEVFSGLCDGVNTTPVVSSRTVPTTGSYATLILRNSAFEPGANAAANGAALQSLSTYPVTNPTVNGRVKGFIVDFAGDMAGAYTQYQAKPFCPAAANLIADGIRGYIKSFRQAHPELKWILIAATDVGVPLYRIPDTATLAPQSMLIVPLKPETVEGELRLNFYGTDDAYADFDPLVNGDHFVFQPELGVGRISEPKYIPSMVASYIAADGLLTPQTAGVFGYNFWSDTANSIKDQLAASGRPTQRISVNQFTTAHPPIQSGQGLPTASDAWNAQDLLDGVAANTDVFVMMAHGLRAAAIAPANYSPILKAEQIIQVGNTTPAIKRMKLLITGACNFGLALPTSQGIANVTPDPELSEIPQALGWTAVAWDAYAYGDDTRAAYSEELADFLVRELRYDTGAIALGDAMARAKRAWATPDMDLNGLPEKSLMTMGIIGFPMLRVDLGTAGRLVRPGDRADFAFADLQPVAAGTPGSNSVLDLRTKDVSLDFRIPAHQLVPNNAQLTNLTAPGSTTASYYSIRTPDNAPGQVQMTPLRPIGPRWTVPLHPSDLPADSPTFARGTVLLSASCADVQNFVPLVSVPAYQLAPPRGPYLTDRFTPNDWWKVSYINPGREFLLVRPAQFRSATSATGAPEIFGTERLFEQVSIRAYYSSLVAQTIETQDGQTMQAILAGPPEFRSHSATPNGGAVDFKVFMSGLPNLGVQSVFVTWWDTTPGAACALNSIELTRSDDTTIGQHWAGSLPLGGRNAANIRYMLQTVNGAGRVRVADNFGLGFPAETPPTAAVPLADTQLEFTTPSAPASTFSGRTLDVKAKLTRADTNAVLSGKRLVFRLTGVSGYRTFAYTDSDGVATARLKVDALPGTLFAQVEFEGDDDLSGNSARSDQITVAKEPTTFTSTGIQPATQQLGGTVQVTAQLQDGLSRRLREQGVLFLITAPSCTSYVAVTADCAVLQAQVAETDFRGDAKASFVLAVALGSYNIHAVFASIVKLPPAITLDLQNARYLPAVANLGTLMVANQRIAFTSSRTGNGDIYSMNIDGSDVRRLTNSSAIDADPDWSPDRRKIAFTSSRTGNGDVYVMSSDGSSVTRLTTSSAIDTFGSWSPDGTKIAFTSTRDGNSEIYVMNADGTGQTRLTNNPRIDADPYWSPDGTKIAFTSTRDGNSEIYVMNASGVGAVLRLTNHAAIDTLGSWSPDGTKIAFTSGRTGNGDVYTMNPDGTGVTRLTTSSGIDGTPDWSPDGMRIVFASNRDGFFNSEIYVMNANGSGQTRLTFNSAFDGLPSW